MYIYLVMEWHATWQLWFKNESCNRPRAIKPASKKRLCKRESTELSNQKETTKTKLITFSSQLLCREKIVLSNADTEQMSFKLLLDCPTAVIPDQITIPY